MNTTIYEKENLKKLINQQHFTSTQDILKCRKEMFADVLQEVLNSELEQQLGYEKSQRRPEEATSKNYRNGSTKRTVKTQLGEIQVQVPRDRKGHYEPTILGKYQRNADGLEERILSLYATGMSTRDIQEQIKELYDVDISSELVSKITDKIMPLVSEWQNRPLDAYYPFIFLDAIHYKVREEHRIVTKACYVVLAITAEGMKEVLGIWVGASESSTYWMGVLNELKSRGMQRVSLFCIDGLSGFKEAIASVYPQAGIQRCIIHQIRNSSKYVSYKHLKEFMKDLKEVYGANTEEMALTKLAIFKGKWNRQYPSAIKSWEENWDVLATYFKYPVEIRKVIYTTNIIEGVNRQFRKITKNKTSFPTDHSVRKILYLGVEKISKKWTVRYRNWDIIKSQLELLEEQ